MTPKQNAAALQQAINSTYTSGEYNALYAAVKGIIAANEAHEDTDAKDS